MATLATITPSSSGLVIDLSSVEVTMPGVGAWHARGVAEEVLPLGPATLDIAGERFVGTVLALSTEVLPTGGHPFRMVAGAGGLAQVLAPKFYRAVAAATLLADLASETGETLAASAVLDLQLGAWARPEGLATDALRDLLRHAPTGTTWRMLADGTLWVGVDGWADSGITAEQLTEDEPQHGVLEVAPETPTLRPGMSALGQHVSAVVHRVGEALRTEAWVARTEEGGHATDRLRWALEAIARRSVPTAHLRMYRCRVLSQNADGTLELRSAPAGGGAKRVIPDASKVPIRHGLPGVSVLVDAGAHVHLCFADGDSAAPFAALWDTSPGLVKIVFDGGTKEVSRVGDTVDVGLLSATAPSGGGAVLFTWQPPTPPGGPVPPPVGPIASLPMTPARITSGAARVHA